jgi:hypothetical protein
MIHIPVFYSWLVKCSSTEEAGRLLEFLADDVRLDATKMAVIQASPGGIVTTTYQPHLLGDYFGAIRLFPGTGDAPSVFRIVFQRLPEAGRYWKDLMVNILRDIRDNAPTAEIDLDYKGDKEPSSTAPASA